MAPRKKVLFLGRRDQDTGYDYCIKECRKRGWELVCAYGQVVDPIKLIKSADYVFTTGYLSILESLKLGKIVLVYYDNPLKGDYLRMHPMAKYLVFDLDAIPAHLPAEPREWAKNQTWVKLADMYEKLWAK